jgi:polyphosphate glucokinase
MNVLTVDVGGTNVKVLATGQSEPRRFASGPNLTPQELLEGVRKVAEGWSFDVVTIGYPGVCIDNRPVAEPANLGKGWVGFDFERAAGRPLRLINDAAMQALGDYRGGRMLFLGLGTGLGSAMVADGVLLPMELAHLPYRKSTYEKYVGRAGLEKHGKQNWRELVEDVVTRLTAALLPDYVVLGGGNAKKLGALPPKCSLGDNARAFVGGFRLWDTPEQRRTAFEKAAADAAIGVK